MFMLAFPEIQALAQKHETQYESKEEEDES
jgi:hypothetical protein